MRCSISAEHTSHAEREMTSGCRKKRACMMHRCMPSGLSRTGCQSAARAFTQLLSVFKRCGPSDACNRNHPSTSGKPASAMSHLVCTASVAAVHGSLIPRDRIPFAGEIVRSMLAQSRSDYLLQVCCSPPHPVKHPSRTICTFTRHCWCSAWNLYRAAGPV